MHRLPQRRWSGPVSGSADHIPWRSHRRDQGSRIDQQYRRSARAAHLPAQVNLHRPLTVGPL